MAQPLDERTRKLRMEMKELEDRIGVLNAMGLRPEFTAPLVQLIQDRIVKLQEEQGESVEESEQQLMPKDQAQPEMATESIEAIETTAAPEPEEMPTLIGSEMAVSFASIAFLPDTGPEPSPAEPQPAQEAPPPATQDVAPPPEKEQVSQVAAEKIETKETPKQEEPAATQEAPQAQSEPRQAAEPMEASPGPLKPQDVAPLLETEQVSPQSVEKIETKETPKQEEPTEAPEAPQTQSEPQQAAEPMEASPEPQGANEPVEAVGLSEASVEDILGPQDLPVDTPVSQGEPQVDSLPLAKEDFSVIEDISALEPSPDALSSVGSSLATLPSSVATPPASPPDLESRALGDIDRGKGKKLPGVGEKKTAQQRKEIKEEKRQGRLRERREAALKDTLPLPENPSIEDIVKHYKAYHTALQSQDRSRSNFGGPFPSSSAGMHPDQLKMQGGAFASQEDQIASGLGDLLIRIAKAISDLDSRVKEAERILSEASY